MNIGQRKYLSKIDQYFLIAVFTLLLAEVFCFSYLTYKHATKNQMNFLSASQGMIKLHPANASRTTFGIYDPLTTTRLEPNSKLSSLTINKFGFISNDKEGTAPEFFPDKKKGVTRIFMLGGSSLAGNRLESGNQDTISAQLEKTLNNSSGNEEYEVLNFGISGGWSFYGLRKFFAEIIYLKPDIIITLDGWNDAVSNVFEKERNNINGQMINWGYMDYKFFDFINNIETKYDNPPYIFTYSYYLLKHFGFIQKKKLITRQDTYRKHHWLMQSEHLIKSNTQKSFIFEKNIDAIASYCNNNNIKFISYLQPFAEYKRKYMPAEEQELLDEFYGFVVLSDGGEIFRNRQKYLEKVISVYKSYEILYANLEKKYIRSNNTRFFDITSLFSNLDSVIYFDVVHYTPEANKLIAKRMAKDIL
ncbi:MAG: SGNH/GDSL hydrolase family protein [Pseudomonadota bacterium]